MQKQITEIIVINIKIKSCVNYLRIIGYEREIVDSET
jgi:hypothetical protein